MMNKKGAFMFPAFNPYLMISVLAGLLTILAFTGYLDVDVASIFDYEQVYKADWGSYECISHDDYDVGVFPEKWLDQQKSFTCLDYTNECEYQIENGVDSWTSLSRGRYSIDGAGSTYYDIGRLGKSAWIKVNAGSTITFDPSFVIPSGNTDQYTKINRRAKTFYIKGRESGKIYVQESCVLDADLRRKTPSYEKLELAFDEFQNYMIGWYSVASKTYSYNGQEVMCQARAVYEVDSVSFLDGQIRKIQGERIDYVDCCPDESDCNEDFEWDTGEDTCTYSSQCDFGGDPFRISPQLAGQYACVGGICVLTEYAVECTSTADCIQRYGSEYVCDLSNLNFGTCKIGTEPQYCGNGICELGETKENCFSDCGIECLPDEKLVTEIKKVGCTIAFPLYIGCRDSVEQKCVPDRDVDWLKIGLIALGVVLFFIFRRQIFAIIKAIGRRIGIG